MPDPLDVLRSPFTPIDPDPAFATRLRARLQRALTSGAAMPAPLRTGATPTPPAPTPPAPTSSGLGYAWLSVPDVERAAAFYGAVLGWRVVPGSDSQGRQVIGRSPELGLHGGEQDTTLNCCYAVEDIAAALERVRRGGGTAEEPSEAPYGLVANCTDPAGTVFALYQGPSTAASGHGDLAYVTYEVADSEAFRRFYGPVLGWSFTPGGRPDGWQVEGGMAGVQGGHERATTVPMWRVDDIAAVVRRVRDAGGSSTGPVSRPYGLEAACADDQGTRFFLGQL